MPIKSVSLVWVNKVFEPFGFLGDKRSMNKKPNKTETYANVKSIFINLLLPRFP